MEAAAELREELRDARPRAASVVQRPRRQGGRARPARAPGAERLLGGRPDPPARPRQRRHRGRDRRRALRPDDPRRRHAVRLRDRRGVARSWSRRSRPARSRPTSSRDGTFTVSNLGMFGVRRFHAVINPPQAGDPRRRRGRAAAGRSTTDGRDRRPAPDGRRALVRPPGRLRSRGRPLPANADDPARATRSALRRLTEERRDDGRDRVPGGDPRTRSTRSSRATRA